MTEIEKRFSPHPFFRLTSGTVRAFADTTRFHLRSAGDIAKVVFDSGDFQEGELQTLLSRLELGLPENMLLLARHTPVLTREELIEVWNAGLQSLPAISSASDNLLTRALGGANRVALLRKVLATSSPEPASA